MHSKIYLIILFVLIIPFVLATICLLFGIFIIKWRPNSAALILTFRTALILGLLSLAAHSICSLIAAPYVDGYEIPEPVYADPLMEYFPGPRYYIIENYSVKKNKSIFRKEKNKKW